MQKSISSIIFTRWQQTLRSWSWGYIWAPDFGGRLVRRSAIVPFKSVMVVSYKLSYVTIAISLTTRLQFSIESLQHSQASHQQGVGHFRAKFGEKGTDQCKANFNMIWKTWLLSYAKEIVSKSSAVWAQCMNLTDRPQNGNMDINR